MAGRRLLDAALLASGARAVAKQHISIRSKQLDVWSKTSSVAKAAKSQTDRVTLTVQAARALAQRLGESAPAQFDPRSDEFRRQASASAVSAQQVYEDVKTNLESVNLGESVEQRLDHDRGRNPDAGGHDGGLPQQDIQHGNLRSAEDSAAEPSESTDTTSNIWENVEEPSQIGANSQHASKSHAFTNQEEIPEDINIDVFRSSKTSELLGGKSKERTSESNAEDQKASERSGKGETASQYRNQVINDEDTANVRIVDDTAKVSDPNPSLPSQDVSPETAVQSENDFHDLGKDLANDTEIEPGNTPEEQGEQPYQMRESKVPSSRFGRLWQYGGLATSMAFGAVGETFRRATGGSSSSGSLMLSAGNMERLVAKLSRMRGAALKLGQMMSFQDSKMLPGPIHEVLQRVQDNADYMPASQRNAVLAADLGPDWHSLFSSFDDVPLAAASIGQVHRAVLSSSQKPVAVKIQYPGVATSISSDLNNLSILLTASRLLPKGLFLEKTIANAREELAWECDYVREAKCQDRFRELLQGEVEVFKVPKIVHEASGSQVLTSEMMFGTAVTKPSLQLTQDQRDWIGHHILRLCLRELTEFHFMQTDPNWTNFLFNREDHKLELLDFGAAREFPDQFVDPYVRILIAAASDDRETIRELSIQLGYLTGHESKAMVDAHVGSVLTLAEPFSAAQDEDKPYDFRDQTITDRVRSYIPVMLKERLAPPPEETYSLHRKLSGAFLLLAKLGSRVKCRNLFLRAIQRWEARQI